MTSPAERYRRNILRQSGEEPSVVDEQRQIAIAQQSELQAQHRAEQRVPEMVQPRRVVHRDPRIPKGD